MSTRRDDAARLERWEKVQDDWNSSVYERSLAETYMALADIEIAEAVAEAKRLAALVPYPCGLTRVERTSETNVNVYRCGNPRGHCGFHRDARGYNWPNGAPESGPKEIHIHGAAEVHIYTMAAGGDDDE